MSETEHKRRVRYSGKYPKKFEEKYKEHDPEKYADTVAHVIHKGSTPAGMHISIMVKEILDFLQIQPGQQGLDATLGYGGHTRKMLEQLQGEGHIYGLDVDPIESAKTKERLQKLGYGEDILTVKLINFANIDEVAAEAGLFDFVLADLGVSSMQIDNPERGFSYKIDGPLDLRMNPLKGSSAADRLKELTQEEFAGMLIENSDEPYAYEIAEKVFFRMKQGKPMDTTTALREAIGAALAYLPKAEREEAVKKSCQRTFQALRIDVNSEFEVLYAFLEKLPSVLKPGGRVAILTFHSGEDRLVKQSFKALQKEGVYSEVAAEVIRPSAEECRNNGRARSTKMRWAIKAAANMLALFLIAGFCTGCGAKENPVSSENAVSLNQEKDEETEEVLLTSDDNSYGGEETGAEDMTATDVTAEIPALRDCVPQMIEGCKIGCAATRNEMSDPKVWEIITTHFNAITFGNELKPDALFGYSNDRCPGLTTTELNGEEFEVPEMTFRSAEAMLDKVLKWNEENPERKIMVRGHVLVWHSQTPEWFFHENYNKKNDYVSPAEMTKRQEWYIREVLTHFTGEDSKYKDLFYGWDVVNEAVSDSAGKLRTDAEKPSESLNNNTHGSNSSWYHIYQSDEYIINAFKFANKYAPASLELYYNDYNESTAPKREGIAKLLQTIKDHEGEPGEGTRISGMGMQGHYSMTNPNMTDVEYAAKLYGRIVGNVQITEFDITASDSYDGSDESIVEEDKKLKSRYGTLYYILKAVNNTEDANITGITFWGTVDQYSWLQNRSNVGGGNKSGLPQYPLLFDKNYQPKPCFDVFTERP